MKTTATFAQFDVVKFKDSANVLTTCPNGVDFYGIVREIGNKTSYVEWYNKKSKTATAEALTNYSWISNDDIERVGSLYHLIVAGLTPAQTLTASVKATSTEAKPKRKYVRKEGSAKPGPKPKKEKAVKAAKPKKVAEPVKTEPEIVYVSRPVDGYGRPITTEGGTYTWQRKNVLATGKFKYFIKRDDIVDSVQNAGCHYYTKLDYNLDFVIVGKNPGPAKIEKLNRMRIPTISEEQWLALIGDPVYKFEGEQETA